jgi:hypothetical protein
VKPIFFLKNRQLSTFKRFPKLVDSQVIPNLTHTSDFFMLSMDLAKCDMKFCSIQVTWKLYQVRLLLIWYE